jgi:hypothetical protein
VNVSRNSVFVLNFGKGSGDIPEERGLEVSEYGFLRRFVYIRAIMDALSAHAALRQLLTEARRKSGLTQIELAGRLGRPQSYISKIENGERKLTVAEFLKLAEALRCHPAAIFSDLLALTSFPPNSP